MRIGTGRTSGTSVYTMAALMLAVFTVSIGFGVVLPLLPYLIERLIGPSVTVAQVARHTGLLTAAYTLSLFLFAPLWGRQSDRSGPRGVLLVGVLGFGVTMLIFSFVESLVAVYVERFLSGMFAAAVTPVAAAVIGSATKSERERARRLAFLSMAGVAGFLLGPMLGVAVIRLAADVLTFAMPAGSVAIPLAVTAILAFFTYAVVAIAIPSGVGTERSPKGPFTSDQTIGRLVSKLLSLTFIVSAGIGVFEVGLALRGKQELGLSPYQIALMFTECSLVMIVMQAIVFSPWFKPDTTRWVIAPSLAVLAAGLLLIPVASNFTMTLIVVGAVAGSAGILSPVLTYWISAKAGSAQGRELGKQTAVSSLGVTAGSAAGGLLFIVGGLPGISFILTAGLVIVGFVISLGLTRMLVLSNSSLLSSSELSHSKNN